MSKPALRVHLLISSLSGGGAERVLVLLARGLLTRGHQVHVTTLFGADQDFYSLPAGVERTALGMGGDVTSLLAKVTGNIHRVPRLRQELCHSHPDVVISFMSQMNVLAILAAGRHIPVVVTEHVDPLMMPLSQPWQALPRWTYRRAAMLVSVSRGLDSCFGWLPAERRTVIYNPIDQNDLDQPGEPLPFDWPRIVIGMGRLDRQKGFDLLIDAFARNAADYTDWGLVILGEGSERPALEAHIQRLGLTQRIHLPGAILNPFPTIKRASVFALPSRFEGFGNSLAEAMACGLPAVATNRSGPAEIVSDNVDGLLIPADDVAALAAALSRLMSDNSLRQRLGEQASKSAERFYLDRIMIAWDQLLTGLTAKGPCQHVRHRSTKPE